jgi:hypothetical protein
MAQQPNPLPAFLRVQQKMDAKLRAILIQAAIDAARKIVTLANKQGIGARTREAQLGMFLQYLREEQTDLWVHTIYPLIVRTMKEAADAANQSEDFLDEMLQHAVGERQAEFLLDSIRFQVKAAQKFDLEARANTLSRRVWRNVDDNLARIQKKVQSHLLTGSVNAKELAADVRKFVDPSTPGGASYAAMRLARTEINNAFHERQKDIALNHPVATGARWNLSKTHASRVHGKDVCDSLAAGHSEGMKKGVYRTDEIPDKPHPHCLCYLTYELPSDRDLTNMLRAQLGKAPLVA